MTAEEYLNSIHLPEGVPEELVPDVLEILDRIPNGWGRWISCDKGWYPIIVQLNKDLAALDPDYELHQCKEKFGGLRYYFGLSSLPEIPCCNVFDNNHPRPRHSWPTDDPKAQEYMDEIDAWSDAMDEHYVTEVHQAAWDAQEPLRVAQSELYPKMQALTDEAERVSMVTCELCSAPGSMHSRGGWVKTLCPGCAVKHGYKKPEEE